MRRNLNQSYQGRRVLDLASTGVLGSDVPSTGLDGASYLYDDVVFNSLQSSEVRGRILTTNLPVGSWFAWNDGRFQTNPGIPNGSYTAEYELFVFGTKQVSTGVIAIQIGALAAPQITVQPTNQSVTAPAVATFVVIATGSGLTYQWQRQPQGTVGFASISGATNSSYTTPATSVTGGNANNGDSYRCVVSNVGNNVTSNEVLLVVSSAVDNIPPVLSGVITVSNLAQNSYTVSWPAATDNVAVSSYEYRLNSGSWTNVGNVLTANISGRPNSFSDVVDVRALDTSNNVSNPILSITVNAPPVDQTAPNFIGTLVVTNLLSTSYTVTWPSATDVVGVAGYQYRINSGSWITLGNVLSVGITGRTSATTDVFEVRAFDAAQNFSSVLTTSVSLTNLTALVTGPSSGVVGAPSALFTVGFNGTYSGSVVVTPTDNGGGGVFIPTTLTLNTSTPSGTFVYVAGSSGAKTLSTTNDRGFIDAAAVNFTASVSSNLPPTVSSKAMLLDLRIFVADSNIRRSASSFSLNFPAASDVSIQSMTMAPSSSKTITTSMNPSALVVLRTNTPLTAQVTLRNSTSFTIVISKLFILDQDVESVVLVNASTTVSANITLIQG